jgi:hypothetical protein
LGELKKTRLIYRILPKKWLYEMFARRENVLVWPVEVEGPV